MTPVVLNRSTPKFSTKKISTLLLALSRSQKYYSKEKSRDSEFVCTLKDINVQETEERNRRNVGSTVQQLSYDPLSPNFPIPSLFPTYVCDICLSI